MKRKAQKRKILYETKLMCVWNWKRMVNETAAVFYILFSACQ